jgi:cytochrome c oxidase assembly factor CtaG/NAD-dependent dihydropyrimidine dehydrogenase PreA subunit
VADSAAAAAFLSWSFSPGVVIALLCTAFVYVRGWRRLRTVLPQQFSSERLFCFLAGLALVFIALASPLDAFSSLLLTSHMIQHLLLMMAAPPLILLGQPMLPMLRGLPRTFTKEGLGPFLRWQALQKVGGFFVAPVFAWFAYNVSAVAWHVPRLYELALHSPAWHDVEHATFFWTGILFWWIVIQPWPSRSRWARWTAIPYLLTADIVNTAISGTFVFAEKVLYPSYAAAPLAGISPQYDQSAAGVIMWVPGSMFYLVPAVIIATQCFSGTRRRVPRVHKGQLIQIGKPAHGRPGDLLNLPGMGRFLRWRYARPAMQTVMFFLAAIIVIDGLRGPDMASMNLAGVLPWIHWRGLVIIGLLAIGNLFCMACPFMLPRTAARKFLSPRWRWPAMLRSKWLAAALIVLYLWAYEAFSLWDKAGVTAWIIIGYFVAAFVIDGFFRGASFCKYVCPIGQFNFINSLVSPYEVKIRDATACQSCSTYDCIRGNEKQRGCELYLFQPKKATNLDCTFCLDCIHACPHDNIGLLPGKVAAAVTASPYLSSIGRLAKRRDIAILALVIVFGAFVNALAMTQTFAVLETHLASVIPRALIIAILVLGTAVLLPLLVLALGRRTNLFAFALVPLGSAMWAAHLVFHLSTGFLTMVPVFERVLATTPDWSLSAHPLFVNSIAPLQILLLDAGLLLTLYLSWRCAADYQSTGSRLTRMHVRSVLPWCLLATGLYAAGVWVLLQPMQMRGMMMMN